MTMIIGPIKFNPNNRGRVYRGEDRHFDVGSMIATINGGSVQERVKNGDMIGYYGHWPRVKFGLDPGEGGLHSGKAVGLEPATRVKQITADMDGNIEYSIELLDTAPGKLAQRLYTSKTGGFSSAISAPKRGARRFVDGFFGFDYVLEPNMTANRGYALDSVDFSVLDEVAEYNAALSGINAVLDSMQKDYETALKTVTSLSEEILELRSMLVKKGKDPSDVNLDGVATHISIHRDAGRLARAAEFLSADLGKFEQAEEKEPAPREQTVADRYIQRRYGV